MPLKLKPPRPGKTPYWSVRGTYLGVSLDRSTKTAVERDARKILARWKEDIERGEFARAGAPTFLSAAVAYMQAGGDRRFVARLIDHFGEVALSAVTQQAIDDAAVKLYPVSTSPTRNRQCHTVVSAILKHAGEDFKIRRPKGWRGSKRVFWLWPEQAFRLFAAAEEVDAEFGLFLRFLFYTGMRLSEALLLKLDNVQLSEGYAYLPDSKNDEPRAIFLPPHLVAALANHPRGMSRRGTVFRFRKNGRLYALLSKAKMAAGADISPTTFHTACHTWATWMRRYSGLDTKGLVATGRWKDETSASRYEHVVVSEESRKAILLPVENTWKKQKGGSK
jgi:integrase